MIRTLAIENYRSLRRVIMPLGPLNLVTGANGSGKSSLYRAVRLLADSSRNGAVAALAREGGLPSTLWAGPEKIGRAVREGGDVSTQDVLNRYVSALGGTLKLIADFGDEQLKIA
jgi:predicted ATPase